MPTTRQFSRYIDGYYGTPKRISRTPREYPFAQNGDTTTAVYGATYLVEQGKFTATARGTVDPENAGFYLLAETQPEIFNGDLAIFRRVYASVPAAQTVPDSVTLTRPALGDTFPLAYGSYRILQPDTTVPRYNVYRAQTVQSDSGAPSFYPTGGTYTLTFGGNTTGSLNYNDLPATVEIALDALASVTNRGGVTLAGTYASAGGITITFGDYSQITINPASLTGGSISESETKTNNGYTQTVAAWIQPPATNVSAGMGSLTLSGSATAAGSVKADNSNSGTGFVPYESPTQRLFWIGISGHYEVNAIIGGTFTITIDGSTSAALSYAATIAEVQAALDDLDDGAYTVSAYPGTLGGTVLNSDGSNILFIVTWNKQPATGGTFTITVGADTTSALAYNASAATVEAALDALTAVSNRGGCTVSGELKTGFTISFANAVLTANSASLTPTGSLVTPSITDGEVGRTQKLVFSSPTSTRDLYIPSHGISAGDTIFLKSGSTYYQDITRFSVVDANVIRLAISASDSYASVGTITECGRLTKANYLPGTTATVPARRITTFYLPGVTSGITDADDIPIPSNQSDGPALLEAIFAGGGAINWQVGQLTQWREGPILSLTRTTIAAADF